MAERPELPFQTSLRERAERYRATRVDLTDVPALTLLNPWAHLVAHYGKNVENRTWMPHDGVWRLLIHAGKGWDRAAETDIFLRVGDLDGVQPSAILAVADLAHACRASRYRETVVCECGEWAQPGQCHWRLANVRPLAEPVPAVGRQGLWRPSPEVLAAVERVLARGGAGRG